MKQLYLLSLLTIIMLGAGNQALSQCTPLNETFSSSLGVFTASGGVNGNWVFSNSCSFSSSPGHSAPGAAMFQGSACQFGNGGNTVSGQMTSPSVFVPPTGGTLTFNYYINNECAAWSTSCFYDVLYFEISNNGGSSYTTVANSNGGGLNLNGWHSYSYNMSSYAGQNVLIRFRFNSIDGAGNAYDGIYVDDVVLNVICPASNDAGVASIDTPYIPACVINNNVYVSLGNLGSNNLTSATINWSVNGINLTPVSWTGNIPSYTTGTSTFVGTYGFSSGDVLTVWTTNPNGVTDSLSFNDSLSMTVYTSMQGNYTIGGIGADFPTFTAAVNALIGAGVCDTVIFDVANGSYIEQLTIPQILGSGPTAPIIFRSASGDSTLVQLNSAGTASSNFIVRFNGGDYITFEKMTFNNTSTTYGKVFIFENTSTNNTIQNCVITSPTVTTTSSNNYVIHSPSGANDFNSFLHNKISGGSITIYWWGSSTSLRSEGFRADYNEIVNGYYMVVYSYYTKGFKFNHNLVNMSGSNTSTYFFYMWYDNGPIEINYNRYLGRNTGTGFNYLFYLYYVEAPANNRGTITNNFLISGDSTLNQYHYGIYSNYSTNIDIMHNSMNLLGTSTSFTYPLYLYYGGGYRVLNNIFVNRTNGGYAGPYNVQSYVLDIDNNNYYGPNAPNFGYWNAAVANMTALQNLGVDVNGFNVNPNFYSRTELYPCNDTLDAAGVNVGYTMDIDYNQRNPVTPDIGAAEFIAGKPSLGGDVTVCAGEPVTLQAYGPMYSTFNWNTTATTPEITVTIPSTYIVEVTSHCGIVGYDTVVVTHIPDPVAHYTSTTSYLGATFTNQSQNATSYMWDFGNGNTSTDANPHHVFANSGYHTVMLYAYNDCGVDSFAFDILLTVTGMEEQSGIDANIFPNPGNGDVNISLNGVNGQVQISVIDLEGRTLVRELHQANGSYTTRLDMNNRLAQGVYLIRIDSEDGSLVRKLIVQ